MIRNRLSLWAVLLTMLLATAACDFEASTANITGAIMAKDKDGKSQTTVFAPTDVFYAIVTLANAPDDTKVKAVWTAVDVAGVDPNTLITDKEITTGLDTITFDLSNNNPWPAGKYKVEIQLNGSTVKTLEFQVK